MRKTVFANDVHVAFFEFEVFFPEDLVGKTMEPPAELDALCYANAWGDFCVAPKHLGFARSYISMLREETRVGDTVLPQDLQDTWLLDWLIVVQFLRTQVTG